MLMGLILLRLVSEACEMHMSMSAWLSIECYWLACTGIQATTLQEVTTCSCLGTQLK